MLKQWGEIFSGCKKISKKEKMNMMSILKRLIGIAVLSILVFLSSCQRSTTQFKSESISVEDFSKHMEYLASAETEGRLAGSEGYKNAADYAAKQFKSFGLEPGWRDAKGEKTFFQPVPFIRYHYGQNNTLTIKLNGKIEKLSMGSNNFELFYAGKGNSDIPISQPVFVGYGIHEPEYGWDDFSGLDLEGKLVLIMAGFPTQAGQGPSFPPEVRQKYGDRANGDLIRFLNVIERKAAGIIALPDMNIVNYWEIMMTQRKRSNFIAAEDYGPSVPGEFPMPTIMAHKDLVDRLFKDRDFNPITHQGKYHTFVMDDIELGLTIDVNKEIFNCYNVIAVVPGTDLDLSDEYITVGAHLDHLGREGDVIYYGANDDVSGCVLILEVAEAVAQNPLRHPVMFVLYTAEEADHVGSLHFLAHPPVPIAEILLNINLEQIGARTRNISGVWAIGPTSQKRPLFAAHKKVEGIDLQFDTTDSQIPVIQGSDTMSFYLKEVPAIILGSGGFPEHHTSEDTVDLIDYDHLYKATLLVHAYITELGNRY